jgi:glycosyltransferase involved in cell wall biosynthesis
VIVTFDADGQLDPREIAAVIAPLRAGQADVVLGSRFLKSSDSVPVFRKIILKLATVATRYYTRLRVTDTHNGFRALTAAAAQKLQIRHDGMAHASEILEQIAQHKLRYLEVPVSVSYTDYSLQKGQRLSGSVKIVWDLFIGRLTK